MTLFKQGGYVKQVTLTQSSIELAGDLIQQISLVSLSTDCQIFC